MKQMLTDEQYKIKVVGEAHNMVERQKQKDVDDTRDYLKMLDELNVPNYVG